MWLLLALETARHTNSAISLTAAAVEAICLKFSLNNANGKERALRRVKEGAKIAKRKKPNRIE